MHVCFDDDIDAANSVEWYFLVGVESPVAHLGHVSSLGFVLFVS